MTMNEDYVKGFMVKAAELGVDPDAPGGRDAAIANYRKDMVEGKLLG